MLRPEPLTLSEYKKFAEEASEKLYFSFLDTPVLITSDRQNSLALFKEFFAAFLISKEHYQQRFSETPENRYIIISPSGKREWYTLIWNQHTKWSVLKDDSPLETAENVIFDSIITRINGYYLFHGAAFEHQGHGFAICGISGTGKTTLSIALLEQKMTLYSDEIVAVKKESAFIEPFPRLISCPPSLKHILPGMGKDLDFSLKSPHAAASIMVNCRLTKTTESSEKTKLTTIFILVPHDIPKKDVGSIDCIELALLPDVSNNNLLKEIENVEGFTIMKKRFHDEGMLSYLNLTVRKSYRDRFLSLCQQYADCISYNAFRAIRPPSINDTPELEPLSREQGVQLLLSFLRNKAELRNSADHTMNQKALQQFLVQSMNYSFYSLRSGNLSNTVKLIIDSL